MQSDEDRKILGGALAAIIRVLLLNGNDVVIGQAFVDGRFFRVKIKIEEIKE